MAESGGSVASIETLDFVGVPSQNAERSRQFYVETLGLRPDERSRFEFWVGDTCFGIWEPAQFGMDFAPQKSGADTHPATRWPGEGGARGSVACGGRSRTTPIRSPDGLPRLTVGQRLSAA